jgi:hypothetical protein
MLDADQSDVLRAPVTARAAERRLDPSLFNARFDVRVQSVYTITLGVAALVFALMLQLLFRSQGRPDGAHLIFVLHYVSFMYLITIVVGLGVALVYPSTLSGLAGTR